MRTYLFTLIPLFLSLLLCRAFFFLSDSLTRPAFLPQISAPDTHVPFLGILFILLSLLYLKFIWLILKQK